MHKSEDEVIRDVQKFLIEHNPELAREFNRCITSEYVPTRSNRNQKVSKEDLYYKRLADPRHKQELFVDNSFFKGAKGPGLKNILTSVVKEFNTIVELYEGKKYSVFLRGGITSIAADFDYQAKRFKKFCRDNGLNFDELLPFEVHELRELVYRIKPLNTVTISKEFFKNTLSAKLNPTEKLLLIVYKLYSNKPNVHEYKNTDPITGLSDTRAAEIMKIDRSTVYRARMNLLKKRIVTERGRRIYVKKGKVREARTIVIDKDFT